MKPQYLYRVEFYSTENSPTLTSDYVVVTAESVIAAVIEARKCVNDPQGQGVKSVIFIDELAERRRK